MEIKLISVEGKIDLYAELKEGVLTKAYVKNDNYSHINNLIFVRDLIIPEGVFAIADDVFYEVSHKFNFSKIQLPKSLSKIGKRAFYNTLTSRIKSLKLPMNLEFIGDQAFEEEYDGGVIGVKSLTIPNKVTEIGSRAFANWKNLKTLKLGKAIKKVGWEAFLHCHNIEKVEGSSILKEDFLIVDDCLIAVFGDKNKIIIPEGVTEIADFAFSSTFDSYGRHSPINEIKLPSTIRSIGNGAFTGTNITYLNLPDSVEYISSNPIRGTQCVSLTGKFSYKDSMLIQNKRLICMIGGLKSVEVPEEIETIGDSCFSAYRAEEIFLPENLKHIGSFAFCFNKIKELKLPNSLESIGSYAFWSCEEIENLIIPASLKSLGKLPFYEMRSCKNITFLGETPPEIEKESESEKHLEYINSNAVIRVPAKSLEAYKQLFPKLAKPDIAYPNGRILPL